MPGFIKQNLYFVFLYHKEGIICKIFVSNNVEIDSLFFILGMKMKGGTKYIVRPEILVPKYRKTPCGLCRLVL